MRGFMRGRYYGSSTLGEKGQVVIPADARKQLKLTTGDKMMIFGKAERGILFLMRAEDVTQWVGQALEEITELAATISTEVSPKDQNDVRRTGKSKNTGRTAK